MPGLLILFLTGCSAKYAAPGAAADMRTLGATDQQRATFTDKSIESQVTRKPLVRFPAYLAAVRIQGPGYRSRTFQGDGYHGNFTVLTNREVETDEQFDHLG